MKQRMIKAGVLLFGLMVLFTVISRAAYHMSIAEVTTEQAQARTFTPEISAQGIMAGRQEKAVSTVENLRVGTVYVVEGQTVEAGEVLFEIDLQDLAEKMQEKQLELKALDLQIQGAMEAAQVSEQSRQLAINQAAYDQAVQGRDDSLYQAQKALDVSKIGTAKDYSVEQSQMTRGQKAAELEKLQALMDVQGRVAAPAGGMVTGVAVKAGSITTGGGDILLLDTSEAAAPAKNYP